MRRTSFVAPENTVIPPAPGALARVRELLVEKFGHLRCTHAWMLLTYRGSMFLRCTNCGAESQGFRVYTPLRNELPPTGEDAAFVIAVLKDGYWVEQFFDTDEAAGAAWKQIPVGLVARYFAHGTLVAEAGSPR